jgi:DNA repair protein RecN (Recombination protein N)
MQALRYEAEDLAGELRSYLLGLGGPADGRAGMAGRLEMVEERLAQLARLERKHGGSIAEVLAHAERCRARRTELEHADEALGTAEQELAQAERVVEQLAARLRKARRRAAPDLAAAVRERLAELAMPDAAFEIELSPRDGGCGPRGADSIEMLIAAHGGVAPGPLREVASGGELSRVMLALLSVAQGETGAEGGPLLVFDEIDAGIGGHTARAVGEHLRRLAQGRQVLCITHLPQVAALAERHFTIVKETDSGPATTTVTTLDGDAVVGELVRMLGGDAGDSAAGDHARELLSAA